jgi:hypothetical protein
VSLEKLQFDEEKHEYRHDGRVVPSVTQILKPLSEAEYRGVNRDVLDAAAQRGKAVHKMIELDLRDDLDVDSLPDELQPYYTAWQNFRNLSGFECLLSEARVYSPRYNYAGTLDLFGRLNGDAALIDAKRTVVVPRSVGPQTAGYEQALRWNYPDLVSKCVNGPGEGCINRYALHLRADGSWRLVPQKDPNDARVFLAALTLHNYLEAP